MKIIADDEVQSAEVNFMAQQNSDILREQISRLTKAQQMAIRMAFMEFKTHKEISEETGLPLGTVKTRIRSAIQALKANMAKHIGQMQ
jgi:RNA polymerase sigma-70 factor (ECF subfamily)